MNEVQSQSANMILCIYVTCLFVDGRLTLEYVIVSWNRYMDKENCINRMKSIKCNQEISSYVSTYLHLPSSICYLQEILMTNKV